MSFAIRLIVSNIVHFYKNTIIDIWGHKMNKHESELCSHCGINNILDCLRQTTIYYDLLFAQKPKKLLPAVLYKNNKYKECFSLFFYLSGFPMFAKLLSF